MIVLIVLLIFLLPVIAVAKEHTDQRINQIDFMYWVLAYVGVPLVIGFVGGLFAIEGIPELIAFIYSLAIVFPFYQRVVRRARDAGMGKSIAYLAIVPVINIVIALILLIKPSAVAASDSENSSP